MIKIAPSVLSADFSCLADEVKRVESEADLLHIDVMDGHFVPNITIGPCVIKSIRAITKLPLDAHLMISEPNKYIKAFAEAGSDIITFHAEASKDCSKTIELIRNEGKKVGIALNPDTPVSTIKPVLDKVDLVLVMSVNPGFSGQSFIPGVLLKIKELRGIVDEKGLKIDIAVDGGIKKDTAPQVIKAGANLLASGSGIYGQPDPIKAIKELRLISES